MSVVKHFRELRVYREAFESAMQIFEHSKQWTKEERYSPTDQIRRSSRSVCEQIAEAWRKRRYIAHFRSKLTDADSEMAHAEQWCILKQPGEGRWDGIRGDRRPHIPTHSHTHKPWGERPVRCNRLTCPP